MGTAIRVLLVGAAGYAGAGVAGVLPAAALLVVLLALEYGRTGARRDPLLPVLAAAYVLGVAWCALSDAAILAAGFAPK